MAIKIYFRRLLALLLCCVLVGSSFARSAYASDPVTAATLAITGGQLAGAGLSGEAALSLAGPVGAVVGVTLGALGINAYVSKAAQEAGKTRTRFVLDKLVFWGAKAGYTQEQLYTKIAQGISVAADGTISLARDVSEFILQFGNWLIEQPGMVVESATAPGESLTLGDYSFPYGLAFSGSVQDPDLNDTWISYSVTSGAPVALASFYYGTVGGTRYDNRFFGREPFSGTMTLYHANGNVTTKNINSSNGSIKNGYYTYGVGVDSKWHLNNFVVDATANSFFDSLAPNASAPPWSTDTLAYDEIFTGTPESWAENKDVLNPSAEDTPIVLNPDLLNPIIDSLTEGQQATMSIIDYLQALQDAWDHALDDVQTAIGTISDTLTGIQEQIAVPQDAVANPTVTNPSVTPETTPVLDPSTVDPGTAVTGLSFDLTQIFPFCIPFDIYDMLATLSATPEAPVYHVHYEGPYNIVIDFTVDLSPWDSVAAVLRTVELLAFCIGLAYVTRSMFIRS